MSDPTVVFDGVRFRYGHADVLHGVSFDLRPGEVVGLL
ncbi:MAG TPA: multidrug ABC transporter ATP-binding protein, partial [Solibacterales bacterium]|nr:multidrug ABC transporter ATP-binding protein [Bryobacterales bacterium]